MTYGIRNQILRINLTTGTVTIDQPGETFYKKCVGGRTLGAYYLNKEVPPTCDPLGVENKLIISTSPLTGTPIPGTSRFSVVSKSPLNDAFGDGEAGGFFGPELKFAGYDAIIVEGKSEKPCYISIIDDKVEIVNAEHLWGKDTGDVQEMIRAEQEQPRMRVLQTGVAGEKMVRVAALCNDLKHWNGRCGHGAVFGSKNLRAIAVKGSSKLEAKDMDTIKTFAKYFAQNVKNYEGLSDFGAAGTSELVSVLSEMGILPTENFRKGSFDHAADIDGKLMNEKLLKKRESCFACPVRCKRVVALESEEMNIDPAYGGPEYETLGALGSNCGVKEIETVCKANELCGRYGMDTIGVGMTIAFAMECFEKGYITTEDTGGLDVSFGNSQVVLQLVEQIAKREGFGAKLAEGSYRFGKTLDPKVMDFCMVAKKMEFAAHEPRGKWNVGLGYAVSPNGGDHVVVEHDHGFTSEPNETDDQMCGEMVYPMYEFGIRAPIDPLSLDNDKLRLFVVLQKLWTIADTLDICIFLVQPSRRMASIQNVLDNLNAVTGWDMRFLELMQLGERSTVLARLFNARAGITSADEDLPVRCFEGLENGALEGVGMDRAAFLRARKLYYEMTGMDVEGRPTEGKVVEMQIEELW